MDHTSLFTETRHAYFPKCYILIYRKQYIVIYRLQHLPFVIALLQYRMTPITEYMADNTGRIKDQGGVGPGFQLKPAMTIRSC